LVSGNDYIGPNVRLIEIERDDSYEEAVASYTATSERVNASTGC